MVPVEDHPNMFEALKDEDGDGAQDDHSPDQEQIEREAAMDAVIDGTATDDIADCFGDFELDAAAAVPLCAHYVTFASTRIIPKYQERWAEQTPKFLKPEEGDEEEKHKQTPKAIRDSNEFSKRIGCQVPPKIDPIPTGPGGCRRLEMCDYCKDAVELYKELAGVTVLKPAATPFPPPGSLVHADDIARGQLGGIASRVLMKDLWLARLSRPDSQKPITDMASHVNQWTRNDDKRMEWLMRYYNSTWWYSLIGYVHDDPSLLKLLLFVDADFCGDNDTTKSSSGGWLVLAGPNSWFPLCWINRKQTATSRSTTESEIIALAKALFDEALPMLTLFDMLLGRQVELIILEDNQATIKILKRGYSPKLRHILRTHKVNLGSVKEELDKQEIVLEYCPTEYQCADIFTKGLPPNKWDNALQLLGMDTKKPSEPPDVGRAAPQLSNKKKKKPRTELPDLNVTDEVCERTPTISSVIQPPKAKVSGAAAIAQAADEIVDDLEGFDEPQRDELRANVFDDIGQAMMHGVEPRTMRFSKQLLGYGKVIEICTNDNSNLGRIAEEYPNTSVHRVTKDHDFASKKTIRALRKMIHEAPGTSIHGSLPCTVWSTWQKMCIHRYGQKYEVELATRRKASKAMLQSFIELADLAISLGGHVSFEWPRYCTGWLLPMMTKFIYKHQLHVADVDGCPLGMRDAESNPILKQWRFVTSCERQAVSLAALRCTHPKGFCHGIIAGGETKKTESYPESLCRVMLTSLIPENDVVPAMPCCARVETAHQDHLLDEFVDFGISALAQPVGLYCYADHPKLPAMVTKLLDRKEMRRPEAIAAIQAEGKALVEVGTWDESTVMERMQLFKSTEKYNWGDLLTLCSIKFFEKGPEWWKYKGRICFRGDNVRDQDGAPAIFQELSSSPAAIHSTNANIAYGLIPGNKSTLADAQRAFVQALLKAKNKTWVTIPRTLWPDHWHGKYDRPMCLLVKALYGHPESGGHWENHLTEAVLALGGVPVTDQPSNFWFVKEKLLLTVYVDDLLLSGPEGNHESLWKRLRSAPFPIALDDPEPLDRFLGRNNTLL